MAEHKVSMNGLQNKSTSRKFLKYRDRLLPIVPCYLNDFLAGEWSSIEQQLCRVLSGGDLLYELPKVLCSIQSYIVNHGLRMPKLQRIALLKLTLSMACCPNLDPIVSFRAMNLAKLLMQRLWTLPVGCMELDWRHFHEMLQWLTATVEAHLNLVQCPRREMDNFFTVIRLAKKFFPITCIEEIWLDLRHQILERMLNGAGDHSFDVLRVLMPFYPKSFHMISRTWLPDVIDLWYILTDFGKPFHDVVGILGYVARLCRGQVDWEPHLERLFCGLLRAITLPRGPVTMADSRGSEVKSAMLDPYAELLANAIGPDVPGRASTVIQRLYDFYKAMEPFYHPSNPGLSASLLVSFTYQFVYSLTKRLQDELVPSLERANDMGLSPAEFNLTVEQVDRVVNLILPIVLDHMLFCKVDRVLVKVAGTIDLLACLRPALVLPALLNRLEQGTDMLESPLRYTRPLYALCFCVSGLSYVRFPVLRYEHHPFSVTDDDVAGLEPEEAEEADEEPEETVDTVIPLHDNTVELVEGSLGNGLNGDSVTSVTERKITEQSDFFKASNLLSPASQAHLKAFAFPEGRMEIVRLMNILLSGFDLNHVDRVYLIIACLSRLFLSVPMQDFTELPTDAITTGVDEEKQSLAKSIASSTADMEETAIRVFERILDCFLALSDRSSVGHNISSSGSSAQTNASDGSVVQRPHAGPEGRPRIAAELCQLSGLAGLSVALAISSGPAPHLRRRLIRLLVDATFASQWEPDTARLIAYQLYWFAVKSKCSVASRILADDEDDSTAICDTDIFALDCVWSRFMALYRELHTDGSIVYRGRAEPRFLALLYVLAGPLSAIHPSKFVQSDFRQQYLNPLFDILSELLFLSCGVRTASSNVSQTLGTSPAVSGPDSTCACPALAEAASSLLAILFHRLTSYSVDLSAVDLMQTGSSNTTPDNLFLTSSWWTPFLSIQSLLEQNMPYSSTDHSPKKTCFWFTPSDESFALAYHLVRQFFGPLLERLEWIHAQLYANRTESPQFSGFAPELTLSDQRNQFSSILIWVSHMLVGLADSLAPRNPDGNESDVPPPWHGHSDLGATLREAHTFDITLPTLNLPYFSCALPDRKGQLTGLREQIFDLGLRLLQTMADLFVHADDSLSDPIAKGNANEVNQMDDSNDGKTRSTHGTDFSHSVGSLFNCSQLDDLIILTMCAAFNRATSELPPCMLLLTQGPRALCGPDLGARSCLAPQGNSNTHDLVPTLKLIPSLTSLDGNPCCSTSKHGLPSELNRYLYGMDVGKSVLSWIATAQKRHWYLLVFQLRCTLNLHAAAHDPDWMWAKSIAPSPALRRLIHAMGILATAPRRADIRRCATNHLVSFHLIFVPQVSTELAHSVINRLENAEVDVQTEASHHRDSGCSLDSIHSDMMFKLVQHRRQSAIHFLSQIFNKISIMRQQDELLRLDPSLMARMWVAVIKQAMHRNSHSSNTSDLTEQSRPSPAEIRYRQTAQDQLERVIFDAFGRMFRLPFSVILHYPTKMDQIVDGSWLQRVYQQVNNVLKIFSGDPLATFSFQPDLPQISRSIVKRRAVYKQFLQDIFNCCLSTYQNHVNESAQQAQTNGVAGQALVARLLGLLPRPVDPPLTPPWKPNVVQLAPPPPPPPLALLTVACQLITSQQPDVAQAACAYVTDTLYLLLLRHRTMPLIELDPITFAKQRTEVQPPACGPPIPTPRPDNVFLMFNEHSRVLASDEAFEKHHHISSFDVGYVYYPPKVIIENPHHKVAYPVFDSITGLLDETKSDWLRHLDPTDEEQSQTRACLSFLAQTLASPSDETRQFWLLLAQRLLRLHRAPTRQNLFPASLFIQVCAEAFGPDPLMHHIDAFIRSLLLVVEPGTHDKFDGITEVTGPCWVLLCLLGLTNSARQWPRPWRYYYLGRVLPRLLALLELNALTVSTSGLVQAVGKQLHPELARLLFLPQRFAGTYGGFANRENPDCYCSAVNSGASKPIVSDPQTTTARAAKSDPLTTVAKTQAGGPINRMAFAWDLLFYWLIISRDFDVNLLHPIWDWTKEGIKDCQQELLHPESQSGSVCEHNRDASVPPGCMQSVDDECPVCLFRHTVPLAHRRVFYARMCTTLVTYIGWKGLGLHNYLTTCLPGDNTDTHSPSSWFRQASDNSVWMRDTAAKIALHRACLPHCNVFHGRRVPLELRQGSLGQYPPGWVETQASIGRYEQFLSEFLAAGSDMEFYGAQFVAETFLPYLVRDTIAALRLKGCEPSQASLALRSAPPDQFASTGSSNACGNLTAKNSTISTERDRWNELTPLANRLRCLYACLPVMLAHAFPVSLRSTPEQPVENENHVSLLQFCKTLMPLLADLCSTSNLYRTISHVLSMGTFGSAGFARTTNDGTGDEVLDGLESGVTIVLRSLSLIPLAGQGDPDVAVSACLDLTRPLLTHGSWKSRGVGLLLLRNLVVVNLPAFWALRGQLTGVSVFHKAVLELRGVLLAHLADHWIEVRQLAMFTLAVFIQIGLIEYDSHWLAQLTSQSKTPYPRRLGPEAQGTQIMTDYHQAIRQRHSGILGLAAFVHAHPYTTSDYLPQIITELAGHVHDPQPIGKTVSDTLSAYSRSHQDNWHEQRHQFTEHQLESYLSVVSAAAYYV